MPPSDHVPPRLDDDVRVAAARAAICGTATDIVAAMLDVDARLVERWSTTFLEGGTRAVMADEATVLAFTCGDVVDGCPWVHRAATEEAILRAVAEHAREVHGLSDVPPDLVSAVRAAIRPAA